MVLEDFWLPYKHQDSGKPDMWEAHDGRSEASWQELFHGSTFRLEDFVLKLIIFQGMEGRQIEFPAKLQDSSDLRILPIPTVYTGLCYLVELKIPSGSVQDYFMMTFNHAVVEELLLFVHSGNVLI